MQKRLDLCSLLQSVFIYSKDFIWGLRSAINVLIYYRVVWWSLYYWCTGMQVDRSHVLSHSIPSRLSGVACCNSQLLIFFLKEEQSLKLATCLNFCMPHHAQVRSNHVGLLVCRCETITGLRLRPVVLYCTVAKLYSCISQKEITSNVNWCNLFCWCVKNHLFHTSHHLWRTQELIWFLCIQLVNVLCP